MGSPEVKCNRRSVIEYYLDLGYFDIQGEVYVSMRG
jgi:hypothetical protein